jgi:hypothetical protein
VDTHLRNTGQPAALRSVADTGAKTKPKTKNKKLRLFS